MWERYERFCHTWTFDTVSKLITMNWKSSSIAFSYYFFIFLQNRHRLSIGAARMGILSSYPESVKHWVNVESTNAIRGLFDAATGEHVLRESPIARKWPTTGYCSVPAEFQKYHRMDSPNMPPPQTSIWRSMTLFPTSQKSNLPVLTRTACWATIPLSVATALGLEMLPIASTCADQSQTTIGSRPTVIWPAKGSTVRSQSNRARSPPLPAKVDMKAPDHNNKRRRVGPMGCGNQNQLHAHKYVASCRRVKMRQTSHVFHGMWQFIGEPVLSIRSSRFAVEQF